MGYLQHGRRHLPGGTDPIPGFGESNLIFAETLAADVASVVIPDIPQTFHSLQLVVTARSDRTSGDFDLLALRFNGDTGDNYGWQEIAYPAGGSIATGFDGIETYMFVGEICNDDPNAAAFGLVETIIGGYAVDTTWKFTSSKWMDIKTPSGGMVEGVNGGMWIGTDPITSITVFAVVGNLRAKSTIVLRGL